MFTAVRHYNAGERRFSAINSAAAANQQQIRFALAVIDSAYVSKRRFAQVSSTSAPGREQSTS